MSEDSGAVSPRGCLPDESRAGRPLTDQLILTEPR